MPITEALRIPAQLFRRETAVARRPSTGAGMPVINGVAAPEVRRPAPAPASRAADFHSILFPSPGAEPPPVEGGAPFLRDLNIDQIIDAAIAGKEEYDLRAFFLRPLVDPDAIAYRHEVVRDLASAELLESLRAFASGMRTMRSQLAGAAKLYYKEQKEAWTVVAARTYCAAVERLAEELAAMGLASRGLLLFRDYLGDYARSAAFLALRDEAAALQAALARIRYAMRVKYGSVRVQRYDGEADYAAGVAATFAKFQQRAAKSYLVKFAEVGELNHVEAAVLGRVARLNPAEFAELAAFCERHREFCDARLAAFDREIQVYLAWLEHIAPLERAGLAFSLPRLSPTAKAVRVRDTFDVALARQLVNDAKPVVCNDVELEGAERIIVVSGPNQGGKTTFARIFGQLHYLARLGLPVAGREARLFLCDRVLTHFEKEEHAQSQRGKLEDDLMRIHEVLAAATPSSVVILNEIFTSTTLQDAVFLSREVLDRVMRLDALCVCVTFIDELASLGPQTVSMTSMVVPENPAERTYKVVRRPADGLAYAMTIAEKYRLTYEQLSRRIPS